MNESRGVLLGLLWCVGLCVAGALLLLGGAL